ncbi:hypothetical protein VTK73DRAFT_1622 [Phialemonium thermophilum]|uniref:Uncharacterized protein n=1 Tax=Phialemonium thermophilum TaxID=223376 RepID=A0ABR3X8N4_9PEZI
MPPVNHGALASAGIIAISVAVAAAIAVYESPELRRMADDVRRRIAIALHSLGDDINPRPREPLFNRPEDAEGFLRSQASHETGVDADDETRRRQREELMYWNAMREEKLRRGGIQAEADAVSEKLDVSAKTDVQGSSFDDFLRQDAQAEKGTYVFNTGAETRPTEGGEIRHRGLRGVQGLNASVYANPFSDENGIDFTSDHTDLLAEPSELRSLAAVPVQKDDGDEAMSLDIYNATEPAVSETLERPSSPGDVITDFHSVPATQTQTESPALVERELAPEEYMTAGQDRSEAYESIQAWARNSQPSSYSPIPTYVSKGWETDSASEDGRTIATGTASSVAGSMVDAGRDFNSLQVGTENYDVLSVDGEGMMTPASWTEVGSVVSESDSGNGHR